MLDSQALDTIFRTARTQNGFLDKPVEEAQLKALYELLKFGPTTMNTQPARFVFVRSKAAKEKLRPALSPGNLDKTMAAPCTVIVAHDLRFYEFLPKTFPNNPNAKANFEGKDAVVQAVCMRNGSLQGAYLIIAARALGLDCGPMSGFDNARVDAAFFANTTIRSNFLVNLGHGDRGSIFARSPRLSFDEAARIE